MTLRLFYTALQVQEARSAKCVNAIIYGKSTGLAEPISRYGLQVRVSYPAFIAFYSYVWFRRRRFLCRQSTLKPHPPPQQLGLFWLAPTVGIILRLTPSGLGDFRRLNKIPYRSREGRSTENEFAVHFSLGMLQVPRSFLT